MAGFDSGSEKTGVSHEAKLLFETLRPLGMKAEALMLKATGGVNTHRGYIFCLGILSAAYGRLFAETEKPDLTGIIEFSKAMTVSLTQDFSLSYDRREPSHGEAVCKRDGIQGIRGEVSRGFPSVTELGLPLLRSLLLKGHTLNDAGIVVLLNLIAYCEDTNIIHRGGIEVFRSIQEELRLFLAAEADMETIREKAAAMDKEFIAKNLSPGGSADLLGICFFLHRILE